MSDPLILACAPPTQTDRAALEMRRHRIAVVLVLVQEEFPRAQERLAEALREHFIIHGNPACTSGIPLGMAITNYARTVAPVVFVNSGKHGSGWKASPQRVPSVRRARKRQREARRKARQ